MDKPIYVVVTPFFPSPGRWKYGYGYDFVKALSDLGIYDVKVFMPWFSGGRDHGGALTHDDYEINGIHVHRFHIKQLPSSIFPLAFSKYNCKSFIEAIESAGIDVNNVAVCHMHTAVYGQFAQAIKAVNKRCKTLLHHHDLQSYGLNTGILRHCWLYNMIQFPILRRMHEKIDCHVFISEASRRSFLAAPDTSWTEYEDYKKQMRWLPYQSVKVKSSVILHNGVDKSIFYPTSRTSRSSQTSRTFTIGCVGNMDELKDQMSLRKAVKSLRGGVVIGCIGNFVDWKDQLSLLAAIKILKDMGYDTKVRFVGSGPELEKCRAYVKENGLADCVAFEKEVRHEELADFYRALDLFVLPSYHEGFGCVFTEAHSCGVPFITCEGQGMDDLIPTEDREKWLCKQRDPDDLARKIGNYIETRPKQELKSEIYIQPLVAQFVKDLEKIQV